MEKDLRRKYEAGVALIKEVSQIKKLTPSLFKNEEKRISGLYSLPGLIEKPFLRKIYLELLEKKEISPNKNLEKLLQKRKIRSLSGIVCITVATKPFSCPGKCIFCPSEENLPKSYLEKEPAILRALACNFDPYLQVQNRLKSLFFQGHPTSKCEIVIVGGTFSALDKTYRQRFVKNIYDALGGTKSRSLEEAKKNNETASHRCVGLTIETRPDLINEKEILFLRKLGVTHVEIGVQSIYDEVLEKNQRGHGVLEVIKATKLLKDAGLKVCYHLMPNLYGSSYEKDLNMFKEVFENPDFKPDYLKIYPCCVLKNTPLFDLWKEGVYKPYSLPVLKKLIKEVKKTVPFWIRIKRLIRDIPPEYIVAGNKITNLRQLILNENFQCSCIRCREIKDKRINFAPHLFVEEYWASGGKEFFLSFEDKKRQHLISFLRLRIPSQIFEKKPHFIKELKGAALIRELHTYGPVVEIDKKEQEKAQHKGFGQRLIKEAEKIALKRFGLRKIAVIAAVGTRKYYEKLGYQKEGEYLIKKI